jgi:hypothetical protein
MLPTIRFLEILSIVLQERLEIITEFMRLNIRTTSFILQQIMQVIEMTYLGIHLREIRIRQGTTH